MYHQLGSSLQQPRARIRACFPPVQNQHVQANGSKFLFDMAVVSYKKEEFLVLDGGVATELTRAGFNLDVSQSHRTYTGL